MDLRERELERRAAELDRRSAGLDTRPAELDARAAALIQLSKKTAEPDGLEEGVRL